MAILNEDILPTRSGDDAPVWTTVPLPLQADSGMDRVKALTMARQGRLVVTHDSSNVAIEQYRRVAAVLYQAQANRNVRTVMMSSAYAAEGKSLTSANLALTLSESYRRKVMLIDADLRRPTLHDTFEIPNLAGLSDWLKGDGRDTMPLVEITSHLSLLPGGRPDHDPMGGLISERMRRVIRQASEQFDWVIIDTPPVAFLPDGHLLSAMVDAVILVVAAGHAPLSAVQRAVSELGHDRILGVVMNKIESHGMQAYADSYYNRYRYRYSIESGTGKPQK